ncbi:MAG: hypothetical protein A2937_01010 [Candidatus Yonathbacteria bacterium RIFCSPLOWO2_01_FULL_47_33b]|uniref:Uncharacterized protein n=1 Tax=Candidatus Yonathbacteria bacterium RIFCSPLOWO2_01_FULL_47_33b TaxID=1802727 RepID=A0A1G2SDI9_9BACT|nr:MAG: hypothetical protein A2937_01010 [Candidatus Yonathbacteria bacterium RIFCSPLOWO2_01_FULL_47_33b]
MSDVQFNPEDTGFNAPTFRDTAKKSKMVELVMKTGLVKDEEQANYVLLGMSVVFLILTAVVVMNMTGVGASQNTITYIEDIPEEERAALPPEILNQLPSRNQ